MGSPPSDPVLTTYYPLGLNAVPLYRIYDLGQPPPRTRNELAGQTLPVDRIGPMPYEVALTMSFYAGQNQPRKRGRIYLGPLSTRALTNNLNIPIPNAQLMNTIKNRATGAINTTEPVTWVMVTKGGTSPPFEAANARVITAGWTDDAWDTQRRRGLAASTRKVFP
jgi:hypothetical protein